MGTTVSGSATRLDGSPETAAYLTATLALPSGETTAILAGGPVSRGADMSGRITLPLDIKTETRVRLRLAIPGRTLREATVTLKPGALYSLESVFSGAETPAPSPAPTPGVEISGDGDTATVPGVVSGDGDTITIGG
ncbi:hypothetical protein [Kytococcus sedentarius]|uniref:hypothetical protein n=1 Tax=Kytococcus sedentarius TaxID=1276 RepID=UPI000660A7F9|nr:hypothetical protein [Kytococcus sedentarius]